MIHSTAGRVSTTQHNTFNNLNNSYQRTSSFRGNAGRALQKNNTHSNNPEKLLILLKLIMQLIQQLSAKQNNTSRPEATTPQKKDSEVIVEKPKTVIRKADTNDINKTDAAPKEAVLMPPPPSPAVINESVTNANEATASEVKEPKDSIPTQETQTSLSSATKVDGFSSNRSIKLNEEQKSYLNSLYNDNGQKTISITDSLFTQEKGISPSASITIIDRSTNTGTGGDHIGSILADKLNSLDGTLGQNSGSFGSAESNTKEQEIISTIPPLATTEDNKNKIVENTDQLTDKGLPIVKLGDPRDNEVTQLPLEPAKNPELSKPPVSIVSAKEEVVDSSKQKDDSIQVGKISGGPSSTGAYGTQRSESQKIVDGEERTIKTTLIEHQDGSVQKKTVEEFDKDGFLKRRTSETFDPNGVLRHKRDSSERGLSTTTFDKTGKAVEFSDGPGFGENYKPGTAKQPDGFNSWFRENIGDITNDGKIDKQDVQKYLNGGKQSSDPVVRRDTPPIPYEGNDIPKEESKPKPSTPVVRRDTPPVPYEGNDIPKEGSKPEPSTPVVRRDTPPVPYDGNDTPKEEAVLVPLYEGEKTNLSIAVLYHEGVGAPEDTERVDSVIDNDGNGKLSAGDTIKIVSAKSAETGDFTPVERFETLTQEQLDRFHNSYGVHSPRTLDQYFQSLKDPDNIGFSGDDGAPGPKGSTKDGAPTNTQTQSALGEKIFLTKTDQAKLTDSLQNPGENTRQLSPDDVTVFDTNDDNRISAGDTISIKHSDDNFAETKATKELLDSIGILDKRVTVGDMGLPADASKLKEKGSTSSVDAGSSGSPEGTQAAIGPGSREESKLWTLIKDIRGGEYLGNKINGQTAAEWLVDNPGFDKNDVEQWINGEEGASGPVDTGGSGSGFFDWFKKNHGDVNDDGKVDQKDVTTWLKSSKEPKQLNLTDTQNDILKEKLQIPDSGSVRILDSNGDNKISIGDTIKSAYGFSDGKGAGSAQGIGSVNQDLLNELGKSGTNTQDSTPKVNASGGLTGDWGRTSH